MCNLSDYIEERTEKSTKQNVAKKMLRRGDLSYEDISYYFGLNKEAIIKIAKENNIPLRQTAEKQKKEKRNKKRKKK